MAVTVKFEGADRLVPWLRRKAYARVKAFIDDLNYLGMKAVEHIRAVSGNWEDQSGNLRSSIGYIVCQDGEVVSKGGFERVDGPKRKASDSDGSAEGEAYAYELAKGFPTGYALIVLAGMDYAAYVESLRNKDVLKGGAIFLKKEIAKLANKYNRESKK